MMRRIFKRFQPPGTAPGTLAPPEVMPTEPTRLEWVAYDGEAVERAEVADVAAARARVRDGRRSWLRVVGHDAGTFSDLGEILGVHPLVLEDMWNVGQRPKIEDHGDYLFVVLQVVRETTPGAVDEEQVALLLFDDLLVTVEERGNELFRPIDLRLDAGRGRIRTAGLDYLAYAVIDTVVDYLFPLLETFSQRIEETEDALIENEGQVGIEDILRIKRDLLRIRRVAWPTREMTSSLTRWETARIAPETRPFLRDVHDHAVEILEIAESFRETATGLMDIYLSSVSNRMNEVMKVLTIIATIFIPLTFIAGVYGMNFSHEASPWNMPELYWRFGYPAVWLVMLAVTGGMIVLFRRKGWF